MTPQERLREVMDACFTAIEATRDELAFAVEHGCKPCEVAIQAHGEQAMAAVREMHVLQQLIEVEDGA